MDNPNSPPLPEYPSSDDDLYFRENITPPTTDYSESDGEQEEEAWWNEYSEE